MTYLDEATATNRIAAGSCVISQTLKNQWINLQRKKGLHGSMPTCAQPALLFTLFFATYHAFTWLLLLSRGKSVTRFRISSFESRTILILTVDSHFILYKHGNTAAATISLGKPLLRQHRQAPSIIATRGVFERSFRETGQS